MNREEECILFVDIFACLKRHVFKILFLAAVFAALGLSFPLIRPVKYKIYSSFQDFGRSQSSTEGVVHSFLNQVGFSPARQSYSLIKSHTVLLPVIKELGLQAAVQEKDFLHHMKQITKANWRAEKKAFFSNEGFQFESVSYSGEKKKEYDLIFTSPKKFQIHSAKKRVLVQGELGQPVHFGPISLTIKKTPKNLKLDYPYMLIIQNPLPIFFELKKLVRIKPCLKDPSIYGFRLFYPDPDLGRQILDSIMKEYRAYLCEESDRMASEQIAYLEKRKEELGKKMDGHFESHAAYLKENLGSRGFLSLSQHLNLITARKQNLFDKLIEIKLQEKRLGSKEALMTGDLATLQREVQALRKQRDSMDLAFLAASKKRGRSAIHPPYSGEHEELKERLDQILLKEESRKLPPFFADLFAEKEKLFNQREKLSGFKCKRPLPTNELNDVRKEKADVQKRLEQETNLDARSFAEHELRLLSLRENILQQRLFYPQQNEEIFRGMDLETARGFYRDYIRERDSCEAKLRQLKASKLHLDEPGFEFISLGQALPDEVSQHLALQMGELTQSMRESRYSTERELKRMQRSFKKYQKNLKRHIDQTIELKELQIELFDEKIESIQSMMLELLNQEISLVEKQIDDHRLQEKNSLQIERELVQRRLEEVEEEMRIIPNLWKKENQLQFSSEMNLNMLEGMVKLVESKNIEHNLVQVQSKPVDQAYASLCPAPPRLKMFTALGGFIGFVIGSILVIAYEFFTGSSARKLRDLKQSFPVVQKQQAAR